MHPLVRLQVSPEPFGRKVHDLPVIATEFHGQRRKSSLPALESRTRAEDHHADVAKPRGDPSQRIAHPEGKRRIGRRFRELHPYRRPFCDDPRDHPRSPLHESESPRFEGGYRHGSGLLAAPRRQIHRRLHDDLTPIFPLVSP